jgi:DNA-directed RNA polymerase subunit RPC12/RpoP
VNAIDQSIADRECWYGMLGIRRSKPRQAEPVEIHGRALVCPYCGHDRFWVRRSMLNSRFRTFLGSDYSDPQAVNYICERCGHIEWFALPTR